MSDAEMQEEELEVKWNKQYSGADLSVSGAEVNL